MTYRILICLALLILSFRISAQVVSGVTITAPPATPYAMTTTDVVTYKAEYEITLKPGFDGPKGVSFHGYIIPPPSYCVLKESLDGGVHITIDNKINFVYEEKYTEGTLNYKVYDYKRGTATINPLPAFTKNYGTNFYTLDISTLYSKPTRADKADAYYVLEVTNEKGEITMLRFKYEPVN